MDEGAVSCTTLSVAPNNAYVAVGQDTGVVNIYDVRAVHACNAIVPTVAQAPCWSHAQSAPHAVQHEHTQVHLIAHLPRMSAPRVYALHRVRCLTNRIATSSQGACLTERTPVPRKAVMNLTTGVHHMVFHPDAQMLAIGSRVKRDAFRLVHLPSCTVFKNWPAGGAWGVHVVPDACLVHGANEVPDVYFAYEVIVDPIPCSGCILSHQGALGPIVPGVYRVHVGFSLSLSKVTMLSWH